MEQDTFKEQQKRDEEQIPTYINISIALEPFIQISLENEKDYYSGPMKKETGIDLEKYHQWAKDIMMKFGNERYIKIYLENIDSESVFIPKFLTPIRPPPDLDMKHRPIEACARFVSLVPFVDDTQLFKDMPDLTCTCQEFLDLGQGDSEEHAMLLCNFFNYVDMKHLENKAYKSYIVYGESVPEG